MEFNHLSIIYGLLCHSVVCSTTGDPIAPMVVASVLIPDILLQLHGAPASAYFSSEHMWEWASIKKCFILSLLFHFTVFSL